VLIIDVDGPSWARPQEDLQELVTSTRSSLASMDSDPEILVYRVEGLTPGLVDKGVAGAANVTASVTSVFVPEGREPGFCREPLELQQSCRARRPDIVMDKPGGREYIYYGSTVQSNLLVTLEFAIHYSKYQVLCVVGAYGSLHTMNGLVRNLRSTDCVPVSLSAYMLLPAMQHFLPSDSRILLLTLSHKSFEDNYSSILYPGMSVERSRVKAIGVEDILQKVGLQKSSDHYADASIAEVVKACKELISKYEGSELKIGAILCPGHTSTYKDALRKELSNTNIPAYSLTDLIALLYTGMVHSRYSWELSAHITLSSPRRPHVPAPALMVLAPESEFEDEPPTKKQKKSGLQRSVGILQVDGAGYWNKKSIHGDAADSCSYGYNVMYMRPEGFSFACCQAGPTLRGADWTLPDSVIFVSKDTPPEAHLYYASLDKPGVQRSPDERITDDAGTTYVYKGENVRRNMIGAVKHLVACGVVGISSDCGFMISMNSIIRHIPEVAEAKIPVALSSLALLPFIHRTIPDKCRIAVVTANGESFDDYFDKLVPPAFGVDRSRLKVVGCEKVDGFGVQVADALTVDAERAAKSIAHLVQDLVDDYEDKGYASYKVRAVLLECTELPGYRNAVQKSLNPKIPVYDAISLIDFLQSGS